MSLEARRKVRSSGPGALDMSRLTWGVEPNLELNSGPLQKQYALNPMSHISNPRETSSSPKESATLRVLVLQKLQRSRPHFPYDLFNRLLTIETNASKYNFCPRILANSIFA